MKNLRPTNIAHEPEHTSNNLKYEFATGFRKGASNFSLDKLHMYKDTTTAG